MHFRASGALTADGGPLENMDIVNSEHLPDGIEGIFPVLSREEELALSKDSTAGFAGLFYDSYGRVRAC